MLPVRHVQCGTARHLPHLRTRPLREIARRHATTRARGAPRGGMRFAIFMKVSVNARDPQQAVEWAKKFEKLLKNPMATMAIEAEGIRMVGEPVALQPKPE